MSDEETDDEEIDIHVHVNEAMPGIYVRFFEKGNNRDWVDDDEMNDLFLRCQQHYANDRLHVMGHLFLNEVLDMLGFERTRAGVVTGWLKRPDSYVDFGAERTLDGRIKLTFNVDGVIWDKI